jgi:hypothetical protein
MATKTRLFNVAKFKLRIPTPGALSEGEDAAEIPLESVTLKILNGNDELASLARCIAEFGRAPDGSFVVECAIQDSIVAINGQAVQSPFGPFRRWDAPARDLVRGLYSRLNDLSRKASADFMKAEFPEIE